MAEQVFDAEEAKKIMKKDITENFDYAKIIEETEKTQEYLENALEEVSKLKVDCVVANIELASSIDAAELYSKIESLEKSMEEFKQKIDKFNVDIENVEQEKEQKSQEDGN